MKHLLPESEHSTCSAGHSLTCEVTHGQCISNTPTMDSIKLCVNEVYLLFFLNTIRVLWSLVNVFVVS